MSEKIPCERCGRVPDHPHMTLELAVPATNEHWDLCEECLDEVVGFIAGDSE